MLCCFFENIKLHLEFQLHATRLPNHFYSLQEELPSLGVLSILILSSSFQHLENFYFLYLLSWQVIPYIPEWHGLL